MFVAGVVEASTGRTGVLLWPGLGCVSAGAVANREGLGEKGGVEGNVTG